MLCINMYVCQILVNICEINLKKKKKKKNSNLINFEPVLQLLSRPQTENESSDKKLKLRKRKRKDNQKMKSTR